MHHLCPSCNRRVAYGMRCCGNPIANMVVMEGILSSDMGEVVAGEMLGSDIGFGEALIAEAIFDDGGW